jgi:hypothetical protein
MAFTSKTHLGLNPFEFIAENQGTLPFKTRVFICYKKWTMSVHDLLVRHFFIWEYIRYFRPAHLERNARRAISSKGFYIKDFEKNLFKNLQFYIKFIIII